MTTPEREIPSAEHVQPTAEQLRTLEEGPGVVKVQAQMTEIDENTWLGVNFEAYFSTDPRSSTSSFKRQQPVFRRFQILHPELSSSLDRPDHRQGHTQEELRRAYRTMAQLVDQNDPYVVIDGEVDPGYLLH